jgi:cell division septation protein DedD
MATSTQDDGFHEIQLNGNQLVFLFLAVTVVSVVIFLCGVLVGRGVQFGRSGGVLEAAAGESQDTLAAPPIPADAAGTASQPVDGLGEVTYPNRLDNGPAPAEQLKAADAAASRPEGVAEVPAPAVPAPAEPKRAPEAERPADRAAASTAPAEPAGPGLAIQVSAFREKADADELANRLIGKGYKAYVLGPNPGSPGLFRVRVGKFKEQREADSVAARLTKEEQFKPWIVR